MGTDFDLIRREMDWSKLRKALEPEIHRREVDPTPPPRPTPTPGCESDSEPTKKALSFMMSKKDLKKSVGETDEEAIKWFLIAARGGMADGMDSLACKLWADNGLKTDRRVAFYWMAKAWETGEVEERCWQMLEEEGLLAKDLRSTLFSMQQSGATLSGQAVHMGPNLGCLLLATRYINLRKW